MPDLDAPPDDSLDALDLDHLEHEGASLLRLDERGRHVLRALLVRAWRANRQGREG